LKCEKFLRVRRYDVYFGIWIVFDNEMGIVRSIIVHKQRDEIFVVEFAMFQLHVAVLTDWFNIISCHMAVVIYFPFFYVQGFLRRSKKMWQRRARVSLRLKGVSCRHVWKEFGL